VSRPVQPCGTNAAYQRHVRHGELACEPCLAAARRRKRLERLTPAATVDALFRELLDLISAECRRAGMLP
jgi:hypothetical protein